MAKQSGLGDNFYFDGYDLSGDVGSIQNISMPMNPLGVTGIVKRAQERISGQHDGTLNYSAFWNTDVLGSFAALKANLNTGADRHAMYCRGTTLGSPAAGMVTKKASIDWARGQEGSLGATITTQANAFGMDWGELLTAGKRTDTTATNGTSINNGSSTAFGWQAYMQTFAFTGTSVTITIQDSADNSSWSTLSGAAFTAVTAGLTVQRLQSASRTATVRQYVRAITTGTFTSAVFAVSFTRNQVVFNI